MKKIVSIANQKGGVGKTTLSVNLAYNLAVSGHKTLLIDIDPQGNATSSLNVKKPRHGGTYRFLVTGEYHADEIEKIEGCKNLELLAASYSLRDLEAGIKGEKDHRLYLKTAFHQAKKNWDYILIDCPPSLGMLTANALAVSDEILIPIQPEFLAMEGLAQMIEAQKLVQREVNPELKVGGIVMNMMDPDEDLCVEVEEEVRKYFEDIVYQHCVRRDISFAEAPSHGRALLNYAARTRGCLGMVEVTKEFIGV